MQESFITSYSYTKTARELLVKENPKGAELAYRKAIELEPGSATVHFKFGYFLFTEKRYDEAEKEFKITLDLKNDFLEAHIYLGKISLSQGKYDKALNQFGVALKVSPNSFLVYEGLGMTKMMMEDINGAQKDFEIVLKLNPQYTDVLCELAVIYMEKKDYKKAVDVLKTAYNNLQDEPKVCLLLAQALSMTEDGIIEAVSFCNKYISLMPSDIQGYIELGNLYLKLNDTKSAIREFEKAIDLNPDMHDLKRFINELKQER
jgi:tetratricopeptide (TPR) repeat protein